MRRTLPLFLVAVSCAFSQKNPSPPGLVEVKPDAVIAVVNGRKMTVADFEQFLPTINQSLQQLAKSEPKQALTEWAFLDLMAKEGEKAKIEADPKIQARLQEVRRQVLANAFVQKTAEDLKISDEDIKKYYNANLDALREAQVRIIFISRGSFTQNIGTGETKSEEATAKKAKAELAAKLAREGKDFAELAKEYSDDKDTAAAGGVLNVKIKTGVAQMPRTMTDPVLTAQKGDIVGPLEHDTGWYIFRVETVGVPSFDEARAGIDRQMRDAKLKTYFDQLRAKASVQLENDAFWDTFKASNAGPTMRGQK